VEQTILGITRWVTLNVWRDGGQRGARRNAWRAMVDDSARSRERAEVDASLLNSRVVSCSRRHSSGGR
jgi:hypothetical protein